MGYHPADSPVLLLFFVFVFKCLIGFMAETGLSHEEEDEPVTSR